MCDSCEVKFVGILLIYERYFWCKWGIYGLVICVGKGLFLMLVIFIEGFFCCGDFIFLGIGILVVVVSGFVIVNILVDVLDYIKFLEVFGF